MERRKGSSASTVAMGDPTTLISQIVANLLDSALACRRPRVAPRIRLSAGREGGGSKVLLQVSDNGIGIAPAQHARIFELFARSSSAGDAQGNGIGLPMVAKAARLMGGDVSLSPRPVEGTPSAYGCRRHRPTRDRHGV